MKITHWCALLAAVGLGLIVVAYLWPSLANVRGDWDDEQARQYTEAAQDVHRLRYGDHDDHEDHAATPPGAVDQAALAEAEERYQHQREALERARSWRRGPVAWLKWTGVAAALSGAVAYLVLRGREDSNPAN